MRWLLAKFLSSATSSRPAWPRKYTGGMFAVIGVQRGPVLVQDPQPAGLLGDEKAAARQQLHGPRHVEASGDGRDLEVHRLVVRRAGLTGEHRMIGVELRRAAVDGLPFHRELLERRAHPGGRRSRRVLGQDGRGHSQKASDRVGDGKSCHLWSIPAAPFACMSLW